ncbi:ABC transporter permease [Achromobacter pestifer]|uniref:Oligopeptide transport system permease protein OppC n=1 Tax=Achromobacter pestifer TaxID=1353889 RepID=A0A6S6ZTP2_9BURK|nr:ABC transporter permease [Achromobacter pestifer]CAB3661645.1 Oligopeptide transport system permease protein OppC [Achromobacter pestifer]
MMKAPGISETAMADAANCPPGPLRAGWRRLTRHKLATAGVITIALMVLLCFAGPMALRLDASYIDVLNRFAPPLTGGHLLGTDELGRDVLARLMAGGRISLTIGFAAMLISVLIGTVVGMVAGYRRGFVGALLMRFVDAMLAFPTIFLILALAMLVKPGIVSTTILISATCWMEVARLVEGQYRSLRNTEYVAAARTAGASGLRIMVVELLPNAMGPIIIVATLNVARAILLESYVSYLGYGIQPPVASLGNMLNNAQIYLTSAPWLAIVPGVAIALTVTSVNFIGEGLRNILEPRSR